MASLDSFKCEREMSVRGGTYTYYDMKVAEKNGLKGISALPRSLKVLLENLLRHEDGTTVKKEDIVAIADWLKTRKSTHEIAYRPARVLMQDFTGVPAVVDFCHQVNLENIAQTVWTKTEAGKTYAFPDTLVGTDSHTTMINGLSVLGWGVGGIEAEAAMLGQPVSMLIPEVTLKYLEATGRDTGRIELVESCAKAQGLWRDGSTPTFTDTITLDVSTVRPAISGPKRPQDRFDLKGANRHFATILRDEFSKTPTGDSAVPVKGKDFSVDHGDVFIAAITSCTNTSNPSVMMAAGLVAQKANALGPLVVAYAIAGSLHHDFDVDPLGVDHDGNPVFLKDIWPTSAEIAEVVRKIITRKMFTERYADLYKGDKEWQKIKVSGGKTYDWKPKSTYVRNPPYFDGMTMTPDPIEDVKSANILALLGDSITTDHISPAGAIKHDGPAGDYLKANGVPKAEFNSFGSRRGNHEVMMRGTFANIRIKNQMAPGTEGGVTKYVPTGDIMSIFDAAEKYKAAKKDLVVFAGTLYGNGSSRDWAAKGTILLGVKAVIAGSFERIHRSNLIGMGVLPLEFQDGDSWASLGLKGDETVSIAGIDTLTPRGMLDVNIAYPDGKTKTITANVRIDTDNEHEYFKNGGILHYVLRNLAREAV